MKYWKKKTCKGCGKEIEVMDDRIEYCDECYWELIDVEDVLV